MLRIFYVQDITTLGVVNVRYCGYVVVVKVEVGVRENVDSPSQQTIELFDQPEGGANALNINRCRYPSTLYIFTSLQLYIILISACCVLSHPLPLSNNMIVPFSRIIYLKAR